MHALAQLSDVEGASPLGLLLNENSALLWPVLAGEGTLPVSAGIDCPPSISGDRREALEFTAQLFGWIWATKCHACCVSPCTLSHDGDTCH